MKKIKIDLDDDRSINAGIRAIDKLLKQVEQFPGYVAEQKANVAVRGFDKRDENDSNITVRTTKRAKKGYIIAEGESVGFAEYGTGIVAEYDAEAPIPTGLGTWSTSEDGTRQLADHGYWYYNKTRYIGTPATHAMRDTVEEIQRDVGKMAEEFYK